MMVGKVAFATLIGAFALGLFASQVLAQGHDHSQTASQPFVEDGAAGGTARGQDSPAATPQQPATEPSSGWHFSVSPYLWFSGMHGTAGVNDHLASVHASFGEIFHNLNMGFMGAAEARHNKFGVPVDFVYMKLTDEKASPFERGPAGAKAKVAETMLAPKVAYRHP